jgi:glutamyl-tRNA(Gln) amidotransferase subunit E
MNYKELGLTVGIEVHQELATKHKLFCACPPELSTGEPEYTFQRRLRPSQSELGEIDPAALFEFLKGKTIIYEADHQTSCIVEMDEEPPGPLDAESIDISLLFSIMVDATPVDEIQVMRKTVVDGSNTGGFQRTAVVSLGGKIDVEGKPYSLEQVAIEEDAARKISEAGDTITYRLDRLGIPLIEITTGPEIHQPEEAYNVAARIGSLLRATGMVRRGLGTIRQDINVSIMGGPVIEVKGVQDLNLLSTVVEYEAQRQATLLEIAKELETRGVEESNIKYSLIDVSEVFKDTKSKILKNALKRNGVVLAVKLPGFAGLTGKELCPNRRLGTEMADHGKFRSGVRGIFHTDELPAYEITSEEVETLKKTVGATKMDAVVIVADQLDNCEKALNAVVNRAKQAVNGVPAETRSANQDGTTRYTRPRPGAARMYPETDVPPILITQERLDRIKENLPELPEKKLERFMNQYKLNEKLANQIIDSDYIGLFEELAKSGHSTTLLAVTLTEDLKSLQRDGIPVENLSDDSIIGAFLVVQEGKTVKESLPDLLTWLAENPKKLVEQALDSLGLTMLSKEELETIIECEVDERVDLIKERGMRSIGPLMGVVMAKVRGKADPKTVQDLVQTAIRKKTST